MLAVVTRIKSLFNPKQTKNSWEFGKLKHLEAVNQFLTKKIPCQIYHEQ